MRRGSDGVLRLLYGAASGNRMSRTMGRVADARLPRQVLDRMIRTYCAVYRIDLSDYIIPNGGFGNFDDFFTRRVKAGVRPVDADRTVVTAPSDGRVQSVGTVERGMVLQAKGREYPLCDLVGDAALCAAFEGGPYITVYLSPRDYHRVHFPCDAEVTGCRYTPGRLFTVAPRATRVVDGLFVRNERISTLLRTKFGRAALVMVGATGVGRITTAYGDAVSNVGRRASGTAYDPPIAAKKGDDLGTFHLGSTVVMVFEPGRWRVDAKVGEAVRMGQPLFRRL